MERLRKILDPDAARPHRHCMKNQAVITFTSMCHFWPDPGWPLYSSLAGLRNGRSSPLATASGTENEYRPSMLMYSCSNGDSLATSSSRTSKASARSWFNAASM